MAAAVLRRLFEPEAVRWRCLCCAVLGGYLCRQPRGSVMLIDMQQEPVEYLRRQEAPAQLTPSTCSSLSLCTSKGGGGLPRRPCLSHRNAGVALAIHLWAAGID